jgi:hypothetical protein
VFCNNLEGFEEAQGFDHAAAHGDVVERDLGVSVVVHKPLNGTDLLYNPLSIDDEHAPQTNPLILNQDAIVPT